MDPHSTVHEEEDDETRELAAFSSRGCCCCFPSSSWSRVRSSSSPSASASASASSSSSAAGLWRAGVRAVMKVREWSEIVAGPRWKTFIRRFNRRSSSFNSNNGGGGHHRRNGSFGYDPLSYALNFDEGGETRIPVGDSSGFYPDFSARFAKSSSMDPSGRDAPPLNAPPPPVIAGWLLV